MKGIAFVIIGGKEGFDYREAYSYFKSSFFFPKKNKVNCPHSGVCTSEIQFSLFL